MSWRGQIGAIAADIKLAHSVFAMPFALLAAFMAAPWTAEKGLSDLSFSTEARSRFAGQIVLVIAAMVFARTAAMLANRILDRTIDRDNPRTAQRAIPSGQLGLRQALIALACCAILFIVICAGFGLLYQNWWPLILALPVLTWICAYGWFKRFTSLCHIYLGSSLAISPIAAAIAINPAAVVEQASIWLIGTMVLCWVAGFDIIYALQDVEIDRKQGLFSIPSRLGVQRAMLISRTLHALSIACLIACLLIDDRLDLLFGLGIAAVCALLLYEHLTVARWGTTKIAIAFFTLNGIISCLLGALGIVDVLL